MYRKSIPDITQQINKWYNHFVCLSVTQFEVHSICEPRSFSQQNEAAHKNSKQTIKYGACILQWLISANTKISIQGGQRNFDSEA